MYHSKGTYNKSLEMFTEKVEKELFDPEMLKMLDKNQEDMKEMHWQKLKNGKIIQLEFKIKVLWMLF